MTRQSGKFSALVDAYADSRLQPADGAFTATVDLVADFNRHVSAVRPVSARELMQYLRTAVARVQPKAEWAQTRMNESGRARGVWGVEFKP